MEEIFFQRNLNFTLFFLKPSKCIRISSRSVVPSAIWPLVGDSHLKRATGMDSNGGKLRDSINYASLAGSLEGDVNDKFPQPSQ